MSTQDIETTVTHAGEVALLTRHFPFHSWQAKTYGAQVNYKKQRILCKKKCVLYDGEIGFAFCVLRFDAKQRRYGQKTRRILPESILLTGAVCSAINFFVGSCKENAE